MISLDRKILEDNSQVAARMKRYGEREDMVILIPEGSGESRVLSDRVHAVGTGGRKLQQFFRLVRMGCTLGREHRVTHVTCQDPFLTGLAGSLIARRLRASLEIQSHGDFFDSAYYRQSSLKNYLYYHLGKFVLRRADSIRVVSERARRGTVSIGVSPEKIHVKPILVDLEKLRTTKPAFDLRKQYPGAARIFLSIARLVRVKNLPWLIETFHEHLKAYPDDILLMVGDGPERSHIERLVRALELEQRALILGFKDDTVSYMKGADALLISSLSEGYSLSAIEARALELPIIMTDVGVAGFELLPSKTVKVVPIGDRTAFLTAMRQVSK